MGNFVIFKCLSQDYFNHSLGTFVNRYDYSERAEAAIAQRIADLFTRQSIPTKVTELTKGYNPAYDFKLNDVKIELKISGYLTRGKQTVSVETYSETPQERKPSGLMLSEADFYLFVAPGYWSPTKQNVTKFRLIERTLLHAQILGRENEDLTPADENGVKAIGHRVPVDKDSAVAKSSPYGDGFIGYSNCISDGDWPWAFEVDTLQLYNRNKQLFDALRERFK